MACGYATKAILIILSLFFIFELFVPEIIYFFCLRPTAIVHRLQIWRIFTNCLLHANIPHILANGLVLYRLGTTLEQSIFGSLQFFMINILFIINCSIIHFLMAYCMPFLGFSGWNSCSIGYSGVIFAFLTVHCHLSAVPNSLFGFKIPQKIYPWILILITQIIIPQASLFGHISGVLTAYLFLFDLTSWLLFTPATLQKIESSSNRFVGIVVNSEGYTLNPYLGQPIAPSSIQPPSFITNTLNSVKSILPTSSSNVATDTTSSAPVAQVNISF